MKAPDPKAVRQDNWFVLLDPDWQADAAGEKPPVEVIVGGWCIEDDGSVGPFEPNPVYHPGSASTPTDPIDALLRQIAAGRSGLGDALIELLRDYVVEIACGPADELLIGMTKDNILCIPVVTAARQRDRMDVDNWVPVRGRDLPEIVPPGIDILLNPGSQGQFRLVATALTIHD